MMDISFASKDCTPPAGRTTGSGGRIMVMDEEPQGKLLARIALLRQDGQMVCICCTDQKFFFNEAADTIREIVAKECDIPVENILIGASHTHSVPDLLPPIGVPDEVRGEFSYVGEYAQLLAEAVGDAKRKMKPLDHWEVGIGDTGNWGLCRRPIYRTKGSGKQVGSQGVRNSSDCEGLDGVDENALTTYAAFESKGLAGGVVNYACHPVTMYGCKSYSPDYPGAFYERMDKETSALFLYANGPNGNVAPSGGGPEFCQAMGFGLATEAIQAMTQAQRCQPGALRIVEERVSIPRRKPTSRQLEYAAAFLAGEPTDDEIAEFPVRMYGVKYHFKNNAVGISRNLCHQLLALNKEIESGADSDEIRIQVIAVSDEIAFIGVSAEMFNHFTTAIQKHSPFKHNCIIQLANGWGGYIPPAESYRLGGYECCLSQINRLVPEAFDTIVNKTVNALLAVHGEGL